MGNGETEARWSVLDQQVDNAVNTHSFLVGEADETVREFIRTFDFPCQQQNMLHKAWPIKSHVLHSGGGAKRCSPSAAPLRPAQLHGGLGGPLPAVDNTSIP